MTGPLIMYICYGNYINSDDDGDDNDVDVDDDEEEEEENRTLGHLSTYLSVCLRWELVQRHL